MAKVGVGRKTARQAVELATVSHPKVGHQGGRMYEIKDPIDRLLHTIGGGFFNELTYYGGPDQEGVTESAAALLSTMREAAQSAPEDFFCVLSWARDALKLRTTTEVGLAVAAGIQESKPFVRRYAPKILTRLDQVRSCFAAWRELHQRDGARHKGTLPHCLCDAFGVRLSKATEAEILKYDGLVPPTLKDVLLMIRRDGAFVKKELFDWIVNGKVTELAKLPAIRARRRFNLATDIEEALPWAEKSYVTWEALFLRFGQSEHKRRLWEWLIQKDRLPYMAMLRKLRNISQAGVSDQLKWPVCAALASPKLIANSKQLPFRFYSAYRELEAISDQMFMSTTEKALDLSCSNLTPLGGSSLVLVDLSDSMTSFVSSRSKMTCRDVAHVLAGILARTQGTETRIVGFATTFEGIPITDSMSVIQVAEKIGRVNVGGSTVPGPALQAEVMAGRRYSRIVILSDQCCYTMSNFNFSYGRAASTISLPEVLEGYRRRGCDPFVYSVNLSGDSQGSQADPRNPKVCLVSGFSERIFDLMRQFEGGEEGEENLPVIEQLRAKYKIKD